MTIQKPSLSSRTHGGQIWGDNGFGTISYQTFEDTWWEGWVSDYIGARDETQKEPTGFKQGAWGLREHGGGIFHCREFVDPSDERIGWTFAIERPMLLRLRNYLSVPHFGAGGYGKRLTRLVSELAASKNLPIKMWISYADDETSNLRVLKKLISPLGLQILESPFRWAPLMADAL